MKLDTRRYVYNFEMILTELGGLLKSMFAVVVILMLKLNEAAYMMKAVAKFYLLKSERGFNFNSKKSKMATR